MTEIVDYELLAETFNQALIHTLRKHSIADSFLDYWVPDADPVLGIASMIDSARIAGHPELTVRFRSATVPEARRPDLTKAVGRFAKVALEAQGDSVVLRATGMTKTADEVPAAGGARRTGKAKWQADKPAAAAAAGRAAAPRWTSNELPEFADAHPDFRPGLKTALESLSREGGIAAAGAGLTRVEGREGAVHLVLDVDPKANVVIAARHSGATKPSERAALDLFCRAAEAVPVQEVADHIGLKVVESLIDPDKPPPVTGVLLPINAGAPFTVAPRLARQAYDAYRAATGVGAGTNFYVAPPPEQWQALSADQRRDRLAAGVRAFLQSADLYPDDIQLLRVEKNKSGYQVRGVVAFSDRVKTDDKPTLMRRLEARLRRDLQTEIDLVAERAKDSSPLRRLT
jgi:hypothetical protein